jgi:magnesium chelatase subunit I
MATDRPRTLGELRASGYRHETVKDEMRRNLIALLGEGRPLFPEILGLRGDGRPADPERDPLAHDILFLGLRGQAKTRMLRSSSTCSTTPCRSSRGRR